MKEIFEEEDTEAVLLIDAANAFNAVNREVFLHNVKVICPPIATYVTNCYQTPSRLFVIGGHELSSSEGTTQGDPIAMAVYAIAVIPLMLMLLEITNRLPDKQTKMEAYADDFSSGGSIINIKHWWLMLFDIGPKFGYFPEPSKCWLIVKPEFYQKAVEIFSDTEVNITTEGKRHLGAVVGSESYKQTYVMKKVDEWCKELQLLSRIASIQPQAAYSCFVSGYRQKFNFLMRTVPDIGQMMSLIDDIIRTDFIPAICEGVVINDYERLLVSLPVRFGGLAIPIFADTCYEEYENSKLVTEKLKNRIVNQQYKNEKNDEVLKIKSEIRARKSENVEKKLKLIRPNLRPEQVKLLEINQEVGASSWLSCPPLNEEGYVLNKQAFWDLIKLRYDWCLSRLPDTCECGVKFSIEHALSCKKGGFVTLRHNTVRNITAKLLNEVCPDVRVEPSLQPLTGEHLCYASSNTSDEARVDISARGFWTTGQMAFFDVRVFNPIARRYVAQNLSKAYDQNEKEKKRHYNDRVLQVEHGSFTPLVMSATGGMARECRNFYGRLAQSIADKRKQNFSLITSWVRRKICFALMNCVIMCIRGSRTVFHSRLEDSVSADPMVSEVTSQLM